jgi:hypothetical protein
MRLTRRNSARAARSAPGVMSVTTASHAWRQRFTLRHLALASMARAMIAREAFGSASAASQERAAFGPRPAHRLGQGVRPGRPFHHARRLHRRE